MCYICNCFGWTLDLIQRALTFVLSCWMAFSICCGLGIAIIAGVAYGYNYCMAEYIVLTRSDVRVYMSRGQFYDKPDLLYAKQRRSGEDDDAFPTNLTDEYQQEVPPGDDSLSSMWRKDQDTRSYAEKLTKYSNSRKSFDDGGQHVKVPEGNIYYKLTTLSPRRVSILPNPIISTTVLQSGTSQIVMRKFGPILNPVTESNEADEYDEKAHDKDSWNITAFEPKERKTKPPISPDIKIRLEDTPKRKIIKMREFGTTSKPIILEYSGDVDEDNVVYKTV